MIPDYLLEAYQDIPKDRPVIVLMRHSIRYPINSDEEIITAGLTPEGFDLAKDFGSWLSTQFPFGHFYSSPIKRCVDTGMMVARGASLDRQVKEVLVLGHPNENGEYDSIETSLSQGIWQDRIHKIAAFLIPNGVHKNGLNFYFTHDTVIVIMAAYWLGIDIRDPEEWPRFLEPFFVFWDDNQLLAVFRNQKFSIQKVYESFREDLMIHPN